MTRKLHSQFNQFLSDPKLAEAVESVRRVDDVFQLLNLTENQHSSILQWLFDPREGHGQGEAIFKDFLNAVYDVDRGNLIPQQLFRNWPPGRISASGFQSLIVVRERSMTGKGRQDLFLVDPVHKFVILVENKAGTQWTAKQLNQYRSNLLALTEKDQPYQGFQIGFVLLDRYKDELSEPDTELENWAYVDYTWLEKAARRAEARASKNGASGHQLVIDYCRKQAGYESEDEKALDHLLAGLNQAHRDVVQAIGTARRLKRPRNSDLQLKGLDGLIWVWSHQNRDLATMLDSQKPLAFLKSQLSQRYGTDMVFDVRKKTMFIIHEKWGRFMGEESSTWPVSIKIRETTALDDGVSDVVRKFTIVIEFWHNDAKPELVGYIRSSLAKLYPKEFQKFSEANVRRVGRKKDVSESKLIDEVLKIFTPMEVELSSVG